VLSSHIILAVLESQDDEEEPGLNLFQKLRLQRSVAQKALESAANEKPSIARPAREARDRFREMVGDEALIGLF
jgi:hypothetical protein